MKNYLAKRDGRPHSARMTRPRTQP